MRQRVPDDLWLAYRSDLAAAYAADSKDRDAVFLPLPKIRIGDFDVAHLSIERLLLLQECAVEAGAEKTLDGLLQFLWIMSPEFSYNKLEAKAFYKGARRRLKSLPSVNDATRVVEVYMKRIFSKMPAGASSTTESHVGSSSVSWIATVVDGIASQYGWCERDIFQLPLERLFSYYGALTARLSVGSKNAPIAMGSRADAVRAKFLKAVAAHNATPENE